MKKFLTKQEENELLWESYKNYKILCESEDFVNGVIDIFQKYPKDSDFYINVAEELKSHNVGEEYIDEISHAAKILRNPKFSETPIDIDLDELYMQMGWAGNDSWEHDSLYGQDN